MLVFIKKKKILGEFDCTGQTLVRVRIWKWLKKDNYGKNAFDQTFLEKAGGKVDDALLSDIIRFLGVGREGNTEGEIPWMNVGTHSHQGR